jgi:LytS/YehU family sensor histidine kinase
MHHAWARLFVTLVLSWLVWALATPLVLELGRRYPPTRLRPISTWLIHFSTLIAVALVSGAWEAWLQESLNPLALSSGPGPFAASWLDSFYGGLFQSAYVYTALIAISHIVDSKDRLVRQQIETARINEAFSKAQLDVLRRQIEPHFLFNALNAIAGLVRDKQNDVAVSMIAGLSEFLRKVIEGADRQEVPLAEEVQFLRKYLEIEKARFADRLQVSVDVPEELLAMEVPSLILQPIVENAIKHGIAKQVHGGWVRVTADQSDGLLTLRVYNDGPYLDTEWEKTQRGLGISNVRTRLRIKYGDAFLLSLRNQGAGVEACVSLPAKKSLA